jgi:sirohydrochlorin ferrochelatase
MSAHSSPPAATGAAWVVVLAHGSLLCGAQASVEAHVERLARRLSGHTVRLAYLNYGDPLLERVLEEASVRGARLVVIVPYFLVAGRFVGSEIGKRLDTAARRWPAMTVRCTPGLGDHPALVAAIQASTACATQIAGGRRPARCRLRATCPEWPACSAEVDRAATAGD